MAAASPMIVGAAPHLSVFQAVATASALPAGISWTVWLPYLVAAIISIVGVNTVIREGGLHRRGLDKLIALGPIFFAVPVAVFGVEHFTATRFVVQMIPSWIPGHLFWVLFVGVCLISAALSIAAGKHARLASALLGSLLLCFAFLIHLPLILSAPANRLVWTVALRDLFFSGGALSLAVIQGEAWAADVKQKLVTLSRLLIGIPAMFFGVGHFFHPELAPGVPLGKLTPLWIPAHLLWSYLTGAVLVISALMLIANKQVRLAAAYLGIVMLLLVLAIYLPLTIASPFDIANGLNYLVDTLLLSGSALALAGAENPGQGERDSRMKANTVSAMKPNGFRPIPQ